MADYDNRALELVEQGKTHREISEILSISMKQVNHGIYRARKALKIHYPDKRTYTEDDVDNFFSQIVGLQAAAEKLNTRQVKASVIINDDKPIGVVKTGDWHVGAVGTDYNLLKEDIQKIKETDGLYAVGAGDYKDNYKPGTPMAGMFEQIIQPGMQDMVVCSLMEELTEKMLVLVRGCHDSWDKKTGDTDFLETLCAITGAVNLWHGGEIKLTVGQQPYLWRIRHKYKYTSSLNFENAMRRIMEVQGPSDVASEAHFHNAYIMDRHTMGEYRVLMRSGSYKVWDEYGQQIAGYKGKPSCPMVIFYPDRRKMIPVRDMDAGIDILKGLRK